MASGDHTSAAETRSDEQDAIIGRVIGGKYKILSRLGGGGMGAVYRAEQQLIQRTVALKILHTHLCDSNSEEFMKRFQREATIASRIDHPNVVTLYDFGIEDGSPYIVMQYAEGRTLKTLLLEEGPLELQRVGEILRQICSALSVAHESGIIHRDLKPDNIMVVRRPDGSERVQVLDFGIAKPIGVLGGEANVNLTRTGTFMGTPKYMAPEQALEKEIDVRCDIYSLGVILYEMITGEVPFHSPSPMEVLLKHVHSAPVPAREFKPELNIPVEVSNVVMKALEKDPVKRFSSVKALSEAFATAIEASSERSKPSERTQRPKAASYLVTPLIFLLVTASAAVVLTNRFGPESRSTAPNVKAAAGDEHQVAEPTAVALALPGTADESVEGAPSLAESAEISSDFTESAESGLQQPLPPVALLAVRDTEESSRAAGAALQLALLAAARGKDFIESEAARTEPKTDVVDEKIAAMTPAERREEAGRLHDAGRKLMETDDFLKAGVLFKRALELQESHLSSRLSLGVCLLKLGRPELALGHFEKALSQDRQYAPTYYNLASYYAVTNQPQKAFEHLRRAIQLYPPIRGWLKDDSDFDNLRNSDEFRKIAGL